MRFSLRFVAAMSQGFRTCLKLDVTSERQKLHQAAATKIACVNGPLARGVLRLQLSVLLDIFIKCDTTWRCFSSHSRFILLQRYALEPKIYTKPEDFGDGESFRAV